MPRTSTKKLQETIEKQQEALLLAERDAHQARQLSESFLVQWNQYANPWERFYDGSQMIYPAFSGRFDYRRKGQAWLNEGNLDLIRAAARYAYDTNSIANGIVRGLLTFVIKSGFRYTIQPAKGRTAPQDLIYKAQRLLDRFQQKNKWKMRERDLFIRSRRDGECAIRFFMQDDGVPVVRIVEPECIRNPTGEQDWAFGIRTAPGDAEFIEEYAITYNGADFDYVDAKDIHHIKLNVDFGIKRGLSDFFCVAEMLDRAKSLLNVEAQSETVRSAIAYVRQHQQADAQAIRTIQASKQDYLTPVSSYGQGGGTTKQVPTHRVVPGTVEDIPQSLEMLPPPQHQSQSGLDILERMLWSIGQKWQMPSWMITGDAASGSYASALTSESPFSRCCEAEQSIYQEEFDAIMTRVLELAVEHGDLPEEALTDLDVQVITPSVVTRQLKDQSERNKLLHDAGILSGRTWAALEDLEYDKEIMNLEKDEPDFQSDTEGIDKPLLADMPRKTDVTRKAD